MIMNSYKYPQNAVDLVSHRYSLYQTVLLSYYNISRCSLLIKTLSLCLIQATYYHASTHRYISEVSSKVFSPRILINHRSNTMNNRYNLQVVKVDLPMPRIVAKVCKYVMLAIITGCCIQSALILTAIATRLL
jgi:hypothetical protein